MPWTKREFVDTAFEEIGMADYVFDLDPEQKNSALKRLDSMMATWNVKGIRIGYPLPGSPSSSDLSQQTNVPDSANEAIFKNLAIRIAPMFGKMVSPELKTDAKAGYIALLEAAVALPPEMQFPGTMPAGAGNKPYRNVCDNFLSPPVDPLQAGNDSELEFD